MSHAIAEPRAVAAEGRWSRSLTPLEGISVIVAIFVCANFLYGAMVSRLGPPEKNDFTSYYVAARMLIEGKPEALYYPDPVGSLLAQASTQHPWIDVASAAGVPNPNYYLYPPLFAIACMPLALLRYETAFAGWLVLNALFLAGALWTFLRGRAQHSLPRVAACLLISLTFYPVWHHLKIGQSSLLVLLLLTACLAWLRSGRDTAAGLALSGAILLKLTPAILLVLLAARGRWRAFVSAMAGIACLTALSIAVTGWEPQAVYFTRMVPLLSAGTAFYPNQSLNGFVTRVMGAGDYHLADLSAGLAAPRAAATGLGLVLAAVTILAVLRRRREPGLEALEDGYASLLLVSLMVSPISWEHHYVLALLPAWILAARWGAGTPARSAIAGVALALAGSYVPVAVFEKLGPGPLRAVLGSAALAGGLLLWILFLKPGRAASPAGSSPAGSKRDAAAVLLAVLMASYAGTQFLLKLAEYNTSFLYGDLTSYYVAASAIVDGRAAEIYQPDTPDPILAKAETPGPWKEIADARGVRDANYYLYPPFFALLVSPLGWMPYPAAHDAWYLINLALLAGFLAGYAWWSRGRSTPEEIAGSIVIVALMWPALFAFGAGQANYAILLLLFGALVAAERGRDGPAGVALAAASLVKLTPGLLVVYYAWRRRWSLVLWSAAGVAALTLAGLAIVPWRTHVIYLTRMVPLLSRGCAHWVNQSFQALLSRLGGADMFSWDLAPASGVVLWGTRLIALVLIGGAALLLGRGRRAGGDHGVGRLEFSLVIILTLLVSPISWTHHAVLVLLPLLLLLRHLVETSRLTAGRAALVGIAFTLIAIYFRPFGIFASPWLTPLASYHLFGQILLAAILAVEIARARKGRAAGAPA